MIEATTTSLLWLPDPCILPMLYITYWFKVYSASWKISPQSCNVLSPPSVTARVQLVIPLLLRQLLGSDEVRIRPRISIAALLSF